ncbi:MAG: anaerobic ribonucleoside-triphosphate reductase activating protein [Lachnospiraceae bacterium]|nr:anaerobic ribonucleoside-triphosphate reductase activating protein [Lachnospiraceae bacterium]
MNYAEIKYNDIANGPGVRTSLFVSGCTHHCKECFNPMTWDFCYGKKFDESVEDEIINSLEPAWITGLTLLGGEPMEPANQKVLRPFLEKVRTAYSDKTVWIYSGYTFEELTDASYTRAHTEDTLPLLSLADVLVDGEFVLDLKNISLRFRGSSNQRILDLKESLSAGHAVISAEQTN